MHPMSLRQRPDRQPPRSRSLLICSNSSILDRTPSATPRPSSKKPRRSGNDRTEVGPTQHAEVGPSQSAELSKTTTLRALLGLVRPSAGSATFDGRAYDQLEH